MRGAKTVKSVTKQDIILRVRDDLSTNTVQAAEMVNSVFNKIKECMIKSPPGTVVRINGFGTFSVKMTPERMGRNPNTGEPAVITARRRVSFKFHESLKAMANA